MTNVMICESDRTNSTLFTPDQKPSQIIKPDKKMMDYKNIFECSISEYIKTATLAGVLVSNSITSLQCYHPIMDARMMMDLSEYTKEITSSLMQLVTALQPIINPKLNFENQTEVLLIRESVFIRHLRSHCRGFLENSGINDFINEMEFHARFKAIEVLGSSFRSRLSTINQKFQQKYISKSKLEVQNE